jgi:hypothetical protein
MNKERHVWEKTTGTFFVLGAWGWGSGRTLPEEQGLVEGKPACIIHGGSSRTGGLRATYEPCPCPSSFSRQPCQSRLKEKVGHSEFQRCLHNVPAAI